MTENDGLIKWTNEQYEPLTCTFMGLPAQYTQHYDHTYTILINLSDVPKTGHYLSDTHEARRNAPGYITDGEIKIIVDSLDEPEITLDNPGDEGV